MNSSKNLNGNKLLNMPNYINDLEVYTDQESSLEELRKALDSALKFRKKRTDQIEFIMELLIDLMPESNYNLFISAINRQSMNI